MKKEEWILISVLLFVFLTLGFVNGLNINLINLQSSSGQNYSSDRLLAYVNTTNSSGQINYTGTWYRNNSIYLPILFSTSYTNGGNEYAYDLGNDSSGNLIGVGKTDNGPFVIKYNSTGSIIWNVTLAGDNVARLAIHNNTVYLPVTFSGGTNLMRVNASGSNITLYTYNTQNQPNAGAVFVRNNSIYFTVYESDYTTIVNINLTGSHIWNTTYDAGSYGLSGDRQDLEVDNLGNLFLAITDYGSSEGNLTLLNYNSSGYLLWNSSYSNGNELVSSSLSRDNLNNSFVVGEDKDTSEKLVVKFNSSGAILWNLTYKGPKYDDLRNSVINSRGELYVTGETSYYPYTANIGIDKINTSSGNLIWNASIYPGYAAAGSGIVLGNSNNIYVLSSVAGNYYSYSGRNVTLFNFEENFVINSSVSSLILARNISPIKNYNEVWKFCTYASNSSGYRTSESCSSELTIFNLVISSLSINSTSVSNSSDNSLEAYASWVTADTPINYSLNWYNNGTLEINTNSSINQNSMVNISSISSSLLTEGDLWSFCVTGTDPAGRQSNTTCSRNITITQSLLGSSTSSGPDSENEEDGKTCDTQWICSDWSDCTLGYQNRTCQKETIACSVSEPKPEESRACSILESPGNEIKTDSHNIIWDVLSSYVTIPLIILAFLISVFVIVKIGTINYIFKLIKLRYH